MRSCPPFLIWTQISEIDQMMQMYLPASDSAAAVAAAPGAEAGGVEAAPGRAGGEGGGAGAASSSGQAALAGGARERWEAVKGQLRSVAEAAGKVLRCSDVIEEERRLAEASGRVASALLGEGALGV